MSEWETVNATNMVRNAKSGVYYLRAKVNGKIIRRTLKVKSLKVAKVKRDAMLIELRTSTVVGMDQVKNLSSALQIAINRHADRAGLKPRTAKYWRQIGASVQNTFPLNTPPTQLNGDHLRTWWLNFSKKYSAQWSNNALAVVKSLGEVLKESGAQMKNPASSLRRVSIKAKEMQILSRDEFEKVVAEVRAAKKANSEESANFLSFLAFSGLRLAELQNMTWSNVKKDHLVVTGGEAGTKNGEIRKVPIIAPLKEIIERMSYDGKSGPLFALKRPRKSFENACEKFELPHQRLHDLRHFFATMCIEQGVEIPTVAKWLGHKDGGVLALKVYGHLRDEHSLQQAARIV